MRHDFWRQFVYELKLGDRELAKRDFNVYTFFSSSQSWQFYPTHLKFLEISALVIRAAKSVFGNRENIPVNKLGVERQEANFTQFLEGGVFN